MTNFDVRKRVYDHAPRPCPSGAFNVLVFLAQLANGDGCAWPKMETIAHFCRVDERQARRSVRWLEEHGQILTHRGQGRGRVTVYGILTGLDSAQSTAVACTVARLAEKGVNTPPIDGEKPTTHVPFYAEKGVDMSPFPEKRGQIKGGIAIVDFGSVMPDHDQIIESENLTPPPSLISMDAQAAASPPTGMDSQRAPAAPAGGGGESSKGIGRNAPPTPEHPDTVAYLAELGMFKAAAYGHVPLAIAKLAHKQARTKPNGQSVPALTANLLDMWTAGTWQPAAPPPPRSAAPPAPAEPPLTAEQRQANARQMLELAREMIPHLAGGVRP